MQKDIKKGIADLFWLGVKIILKNKDNHILLLKVQKKNETFWELPGGRVDVGETELEALYRELQEEAGITAMNNVQHVTMTHSSFRCKLPDGMDVGLIFSVYCGTVDDNIVILSDDHVEYAWMTELDADRTLGHAYVLSLTELSVLCK